MGPIGGAAIGSTTSPGAAASQNSGFTVGGGQAQQNQWAVDSASRQRVEDALMARLQPQFDQQNRSARTALLNSGVEQNTDAYRNQLESLARQQNDARLGVINAGGQEESRTNTLRAALQQQGFAQDLGSAQFANATRQQQLQELLMLRQQPLTELGFLMGTQPAMPTQGSYYTNNAAAPDMIGAAGVQQSADAASRASRNAGWQAAANLGGALLNYYGNTNG
jgi:hypothetical protein